MYLVPYQLKETKDGDQAVLVRTRLGKKIFYSFDEAQAWLSDQGYSFENTCLIDEDEY